MFENLYSTKMSADKRQLQNRFYKIRSKSGRSAKIMSLAASVTAAAITLCCAAGVAAVANEEKNFYVNGKGYSVEPVLIENSLATHTDCYYLPLRKTFEALGYTVYYDEDKSKYERYMDKIYSFPAFETDVHREFSGDDGETYVIEYNPYDWQKPLITNNIDYYIYGATGGFNMQMPIIEMKKGGVTEFCQPGSRKYSNGYALAPVLIGDTVYIPLRAVANIIGGMDNVKWDDEKHDTYFDGVLTFNEEDKSIKITI